MKRQQMGVAAVIVRQGRVLLVKRDRRQKFEPGKWSLPGGAVEFGEAPVDSLLRELQEETGLRNVDVGEILGISTRVHDHEREKKHVVLLVFSAETSEHPVIGDEIEDVTWAGSEDLKGLEMIEGDRMLLEKILGD